jgi:hypothetical protein
MHKIVVLLLLCFTTLVVTATQYNVNNTMVWPHPHSVTIDDSQQTIALLSNYEHLKFTFTSSVVDLQVAKFVTDALNRYSSIMFYSNNTVPSRLNSRLCALSQQYICLDSIEFNINSDKMDLEWNMNEEYTLVVQKSTISIKSETVWGTLRALETLSQLVVVSEQQDHQLYYTLHLNTPFTIADKPRFQWRGMIYLY